MVFAVYEQGMRIHTPVDKLLKRRGVDRIAETTATRRTADAPGEHEHPEQFQPQRFGGVQSHPPVGEETEHRSGLAQTAQRAYRQAQTAGTPEPRGLRAYQVMTSPVVTLPPETPLREAWALFKEKGFHHIPVLDQQQRLLGVITDRDLLHAAADLDQPQHRTTTKTPSSPSIIELIHQHVLTATPEAGLTEVVQVMLEHRIDSMPVVDHKGALVGIITQSDILRTVLNQAPLELWS